MDVKLIFGIGNGDLALLIGGLLAGGSLSVRQGKAVTRRTGQKGVAGKRDGDIRARVRC